MRPTEDDAKTGYLLNFGKFVRYPQDLPPNTFDICLPGQESIDNVAGEQFQVFRLGQIVRMDGVKNRVHGPRPISAGCR